MVLSGLFGGDERKQKEQQMKQEGRLPPGQSLTLKWPVLHYGSVPRFDPARWDFRISGLVKNPIKLSWEEFNRLPRITTTSDFHCVTRWSRFDNHWQGVAFREIMKLAEPDLQANYVLVHAEQGYTANIPLADLDRDNVLLATHHDGKPLEPDHGYPLRLIVPHLYAWKSVKWVRGFEFLESDAPGFWERNGYHMYGDPWREQRFDTDRIRDGSGVPMVVCKTAPLSSKPIATCYCSPNEAMCVPYSEIGKRHRTERYNPGPQIRRCRD